MRFNPIRLKFNDRRLKPKYRNAIWRLIEIYPSRFDGQPIMLFERLHSRTGESLKSPTSQDTRVVARRRFESLVKEGYLTIVPGEQKS